MYWYGVSLDARFFPFTRPGSIRTIPLAHFFVCILTKSANGSWRKLPNPGLSTSVFACGVQLQYLVLILGTSAILCLFFTSVISIKHIKPGAESQNRRFLESYIPKVPKWPQLSGISSLALLSSPVRPSCVAARLLGTRASLCRNQTVFLFASQAMKGCLAVWQVSWYRLYTRNLQEPDSVSNLE